MGRGRALIYAEKTFVSAFSAFIRVQFSIVDNV